MLGAILQLTIPAVALAIKRHGTKRDQHVIEEQHDIGPLMTNDKVERLSSVETATLLWAVNLFENWDLCSPEKRAASSSECFLVATIKNKR
jgi:hypothetical protein